MQVKEITHRYHNLFGPVTGFAVLAVVIASVAGCRSSNPTDPEAADESVLYDLFDNIGPTTPTQAARDAFNMYDPDIRRRSVELLTAAEFGGELPYLRMYRLLIDDPDPTVRAACIKALGIHGEVEDVARVVPYIKDDNAFVRWETAKALQRIHNPLAVDSLIDTLMHDEDADVRMAAATALGQYPQRRVFHALIGGLADVDYGVVDASQKALVTLTGIDQGVNGSAWMAWAETNSDRLFANQQTYTFTPYQPPEGLLDKVQFWKPRQEVQPQVPVGKEVADEVETIENG